jgi:methionyl-tRNA synthetase
MNDDNHYLITTAIPYTNGAPHIGHALEFVQSDVIARYQKQIGKQVFATHGTDEHGTKIADKALEQDKQPQELVDELTDTFKQLHERLGSGYDVFTRTTSSEHARTTQAVWNKLDENGHIYKDSYEGWYCVGCESFVPDTTAEDNGRICPDHQQQYERLEEENYFFKLDSFVDQIKTAITSGEFAVSPKSRRNEALAMLEDVKGGVSISRPKEKLQWGVPVPGDDNHVIYVWFDAVINYLTAVGYPDGEQFKNHWPPDIQVIGKDIIRFHALLFPAMLLGLDLPLAKGLLVHGFISVDGQKMSKSIGNVVDPFAVVDQYGADAFRYYLLRYIPAGEDGDFSWAKFEQAYNGELANDLGNLVQRVRTMINRYQNGIIGEIPAAEHDVARYHEALEAYKFDVALDEVWAMVHGLNKYLEQTKPWQLAKDEDEEQHLQEVLSYSVSSILQVAQILTPFMPDTSTTITSIFDSGVVKNDVEDVLFPRKHNYTVES